MSTVKKQLSKVDREEQDLFLVEKYKNHEISLRGIAKLKLTHSKRGNKCTYYPRLRRFYEYILFKGKKLKGSEYVDFYNLFVANRGCER